MSEYNFDVAAIHIHTKWDREQTNYSHDQFKKSGIPKNNLFFLLDGDTTPAITTCLNFGIQSAIKTKCKYVFWSHSDFNYDDPNWFQTLSRILDENPSILKICASNSRDTKYPLRLGQEQGYLLRSKDFTDKPWLYFNEQYLKCGGLEDWDQSLQILGRGYLILITPEATIYHKGAQTRSQYDSNPDQWHNHGVFANLTGFGCVKEVHIKEHFGIGLDEVTFYERLNAINPVLRTALELPETYYQVLQNRKSSGINMEFFK